MADRFEAARRKMVERQIARRGVADERVLEAIGRVAREAFVPADLAEFAYEDNPLPIAEGQTISQPYIVALMAEAARIGPGARVLEVGTGSGYAAAILCELAGEVVTIERHRALADAARQALHGRGYANVTVVHGDGTLGVAERAPYDAIIVAAEAPAPPESLKRQLAEGGRLVIPISSDGHQELVVVTRRGDSFNQEGLGPVRFVPLMGAEGWLEHEFETSDPRRAAASKKPVAANVPSPAAGTESRPPGLSMPMRSDLLPHGPLTARTVHLCVDMQNLFGEDTPWHTPWLKRVLPVVTAIVERHPERTIFTRFIPPREPDEMPGAWKGYWERWEELTVGRIDQRLLELVEPLGRFAPPAAVLDKHFYSPFHGTDLAQTLRTRGIDSLVISGAETDMCVLAAVLDAVDLGMRVVLPTDAMCSSSDEKHDALLSLYRDRFSQQIETADAETILSCWL